MGFIGTFSLLAALLPSSVDKVIEKEPHKRYKMNNFLKRKKRNKMEKLSRKKNR